MTPKQRAYIESLAREAGVGRTWLDGLRYVYGGYIPRQRLYGRDGPDVISHAIDVLKARADRCRRPSSATAAR